MMPSKVQFGTGSSGGGGGGGGGGAVALSDLTIRRVGPGTGTITGTYTIGSDGNIYNQNGAVIGTWLTSGSASSYQVEAVQTSGDAISGTLGSWLACSASRSWSLSAGAGHVSGATMSVSIRDAAAPNTVRATATITFDIENA